jgi:hypothetical protein
MPPLRRIVLGLNAATVLLVVGGIVLLVAPSSVPAARVSPMVASTGGLPDSVRQVVAPDLGAADRVVRTDIFSPRRAAPPRRSMFGEATSDADVAVPSEQSVSAPLAGEAMDSTTASTANDAVPHLYGTMIGPESTALLRLEASVAEPRIYRVGDRAGGYRVVEIADRSVTLAGPSGRVVLRLKQPNE